ncbi:hypothetical protein L1049_011517 [Liquidambar formosana]|uniref:Uncharacterized protein n=1 Tax=Liquidambar formosana TaxID=63359 RepID=A0AAP0RRM5_LIQFO
MKYVKLHKCKLQQDELWLSPENTNRRGSIGHEQGRHDMHKVSKLVEAMQRVIMTKEQRLSVVANKEGRAEQSDGGSKQGI